ncbi:response regulator transcription factor [Bordetella genomosp. 4]|uniref:DNA-binding response regulator n=1 Tax=Bordetella genomosp. 4 TaxID=463044 RepID=A0A261UB08_9BORD|nr:response regulator transcription factor [Bordetella genomosp. 4]OZI52653.1 DNA-binding response regulator [Bordetella genomosp. 4]OZI59108.1 DNA-binding response regulator [Bordetella genomosp. 4]
MWRCLIVEDDADNARYIANGLKELGYDPVISMDGPTALQRATAENWDAIILDRMLPNDVDGLSILWSLRALGKKTPVLVLSALTALDERVRGLKAGGDDYLTKPFAFPELAARVEALIRRSSPQYDRRQLTVADLSLDLVSGRVTRGGRQIALQPREYKLLAYMMNNADQVLTRTMLLATVWGYRYDPQTNVIDVHISRLRQKIDGDTDTPLIHTVRGVGYRLSAQPQIEGDGKQGAA